jgi:cytochrome c biogenesis protein CcmG/thiol:disulfide interchange protein DsbE
VKAKLLLPLAVFLVLAVFLGIGLTRDPRKLPSNLLDRPAPRFTLQQVAAPDKTFSPADMQGQVWLLNVWASWCVACRVEHPLLMEMARANTVPVVGLDYKDKPQDALKFLARHGNPYQVSALDLDGRVGIDYGVYGVPETFVIDQQGRIRYKHVGPITPESLEKEILPVLAELRRPSP